MRSKIIFSAIVSTFVFFGGCVNQSHSVFSSTGDARQVLVVTADAPGDFHATVEGFENVEGTRRRVLGPMRAVIGRNGLSYQKREGDGCSPAGTFTLTQAFGSEPEPVQVKLPYRQTTANDFWVDDVKSPLYNAWQKGPANGRWNSAEDMLRKDGLYKYAVVIDYNPERTPGRGSAIFLHLWRGPDKPTAGCTALAEPDVIKILAWLDPAKYPRIIQKTK